MATLNLELSNREGRDGRHDLMFRITHQRRLARIHSGISIKKKDFNTKARFGHWVRTSEIYHNRLNNQLKESYMHLQEFIHEFLLEKPSSTVKEIMQGYRGIREASSSDWLKYFDKVRKDYHAIGKDQFALKLKYVRNKVAAYLNGRIVHLEDTDLEFIKGFQAYLHQIGNGQNTIDKNIKTVKQLYRKAIHDDLVLNPNIKVLDFKSHTVPVERDKLVAEEIETIETLELELGGLVWHARNFFLFSFYCAGMRFTDVATLCWRNLIDGTHLRYRMSKTKKLQYIKMPSKALEIIEIYKPEEVHKEEPIFPILDSNFLELSSIARIRRISSQNALINKSLKLLASKAKIDKNISFHTARHSFAYIGFKQTKDVVAIQSLLQHSKLKETQDYITSLSNDEDKDLLGEIFN